MWAELRAERALDAQPPHGRNPAQDQTGTQEPGTADGPYRRPGEVARLVGRSEVGLVLTALANCQG